MSSSSITACIQNQICILKSPLTLADGTVLPSGSKLLILPTTTANCVLTGDGQSLEEALSSINATQSATENIIGDLQALFTRCLSRLNSMEIWAANQGFVAATSSTDSSEEA